MPTATPLTDAINALTQYANETTGASDTTLSDAVGTLVAGYGGGGSDENFVKVAMGALTSVDNSDITSVREYAFANQPNLTYINLPNLTRANHNAFRGCPQLEEIHMPICTGNIGNDCFSMDVSLETLDAPMITQAGTSAFNNCPLSNLHILPNFQRANGAILFRYSRFTVMVLPQLNYASSNLFIDCSLVTVVDIGPGLSSIPSQMLNRNAVLENIIFRRTSGIVTLTNANGLWGDTSEPAVHKKIWVPNDLIGTYETSTNWATLFNAGYITFHAIEGSQYETHYADGTPIE